ncbi:N-acetyltransferase [Rhodophyticola sp. CCM32]|uniref:GNAT family N-acetyltransferase n=1 Tax=Rhodophyticola sp. CCM32 TaxID=2916397 RepID=UPI00107F431A|nr:N-acetyltransferase [Rhodophyticola sp. CCM32]
MDFSKSLQTERLALSPVASRDLIFFVRLVGDARVRQFLGGPVPWLQRLRQFRTYRQGHPKIGIWVARTSGREDAVGLVVLSPHKDGEDYEISYQFRPKFWGKGLACEATARVVVPFVISFAPHYVFKGAAQIRDRSNPHRSTFPSFNRSLLVSVMPALQ